MAVEAAPGLRRQSNTHNKAEGAGRERVGKAKGVGYGGQCGLERLDCRHARHEAWRVPDLPGGRVVVVMASVVVVAVGGGC